MVLWTDEIVQKCVELRRNGLTYQAIAREVGQDLTRNMVIGKLKRLGLGSSPRPAKKAADVEARSAPRTRDKMVTVTPIAGLVAPMPLPAAPIIAGEPVHILDLKKHHCRAVLDARGWDGLALYCGAPKVVGSSYCEPHTAMFTSPLKDSGQTSNSK